VARWGFYGRRDELDRLRDILGRDRWFFVKITGRRRIGKTTLIRQALEVVGQRNTYYVQIPDSGEAGVISAVVDALETFRLPPERYPRPRNMSEVAKLVEALAEDGFIVVLDEFQYFNRPGFAGFCSLLQAAADRLSKAGQVRGGWVVLGSIHAEMVALLEERSAPLYGRVTNPFELGHLDVASVLTALREHADAGPERLLFLWTLFEGVPKYYRDAFEEGVLAGDRRLLLRRMFFDSSAPLQTEADTWFLREIGGKADTVLKFVARHAGMMHKELVNAIRDASGEDVKNIGSYLATLTERYRLIERKLPVFAREDARKGRYYVTDNFLAAWLAALASRVSARTFRPVEQLVAEADERMETVEGIGLEKLVGQIYEERSRRGIGDFPLTQRIRGYWDKKDTEIDLVAVNEKDNRIRFGSCKRSPDKLLSDITNFKNHVDRFLNENRTYQTWQVEYVAVAPRLNTDERKVLTRADILPQALDELAAGLDE
jgi:AAA+ ATPase superfamily predicted ATPase